MVNRPDESVAPRAFRLLSWWVLATTLVVIVSGDVVQATDSGAGCGENWPRCDGALVPGFDDAATGIEFVHRGLTIVLSFLVVALFVTARRAFRPGRRIRAAVDYVVAFFVIEVMIGALLVVFGWVDQDASFGRVVADGVHVVNTFFLLGASALVVHYAAGGRSVILRPSGPSRSLIRAGLAVLLLIAITGAINSLADALFAADTVIEGLREEFGPAAPLLVRFRAVHPVIAVAGGVAVFAISRVAAERAPAAAQMGRLVQGLIGVQFLIGILNIALLTPLETQIIHLLLADLLWISFLFLWWRLPGAAGSRTPRRRRVVTGGVP